MRTRYIPSSKGNSLYAVYLTLSCFGLMAALSKVMNWSSSSSPEVIVPEINYQMPRPISEEKIETFTLEGRQIEREYKAQPKINTIAPIPEARGSKVQVVGKKGPGQNPTDPTSSKKNVAKKDGSKEPAAETANKEKYQSAERSKEAEPKRLSPTGTGESEPEVIAGPPPAPKKTAATVAQKSALDRQKEIQARVAALKALLFKDPNPANIKAWVQSYLAKEISIQEFYGELNTLNQDPRANAQIMALYGLELTPSLSSFLQLVSATEGNQIHANNPQYVPYLDRILLGYNRSSHLPILEQALRSKDVKVLIKTAQVINSGIEKIKAGQPIDPNGNPAAQSLGVAAYQMFVTSFISLKEINDPVLTQQVTSFFNQLQSANPRFAPVAELGPRQ